MKFSEFAKNIINSFLMIFALIILIITVLRTIFYPDLAFDLKSIYIIMGFSLLGSLMNIILYSSHDLSEQQMRVRIVVHFGALELILISLAAVLGFVNNALHVIIMALEIAVIYVIVRLLSWQNDKKDAKKINEKLKMMR
ncbi:hypothetical protein A8L34_23050 [Bacillus sp. FJAT-27264]|uniref:DUF3021 family protein n=1 Tax=Paenibacillus sp. (strain DSM 101736 / FJAT-27264) TaxID=1850362 RepID=UPI000807CBB1|nr:DUF3021 family protein [Bacillus sp. FJAT-27264]OBZ09027.1 hypothetical protein A8L34_23050 [Bacillus sp. FJAT-27264]